MRKQTQKKAAVLKKADDEGNEATDEVNPDDIPF